MGAGVNYIVTVRDKLPLTEITAYGVTSDDAVDEVRRRMYEAGRNVEIVSVEREDPIPEEDY